MPFVPIDDNDSESDDGSETSAPVLTREQQLQEFLAAENAVIADAQMNVKRLRAELAAGKKAQNAVKFAKAITKLSTSLLSSRGTQHGFNVTLDDKTVQDVSNSLGMNSAEFKYAAAVVGAARDAAQHAHGMLTRPALNDAALSDTALGNVE